MKASTLIRKLESDLEAANAYGKDFSKDPQKVLRKGLARTIRISKSFARMLRRRDFDGLDEFFFARENLVPGGKEYWFFDVVSTRGDRTQLVLTFGRSDAKASVNRHDADKGKVAVVGWFYSGRRKVFLDCSLALQNCPGALRTDAFTFSGRYPSYELVVDKKTRIRFSKPRNGVAYEGQPASIDSLGVGMLNLYLDAVGTIDGKKFKGVGYVQKVVVVAPFVPWNWLHVVFSDKSVLDYFVVRPVKDMSSFRVIESASYRLASGKTYKFNDVSFRRLAGDRWLLESADFVAYLRTYSFKPFLLKGRGEFHYDEYLVECTDFVFKGKTLQSGIGMVEDAYGFMI